jgi:Homeodomain-like domain-containing protein
MVNQTLLDKMVALRRSGYSMREIAGKVGRSERTVRRYVKDVEPQVELRDVFDTAQLMDWFYDEVLARRRWTTTQAGEHWDESFDLGVEDVDSTMKLLRQRVESMEEISLRRLKSDESLRRQFFEEFISPVILRWISVLRGVQMQKMLDREFGPYGWEEVDEDAEDPDVWL